MKSPLLCLLFYLAVAYSIQGQNTSPFWSLNGNTNATLANKVGTVNNVSLRFVTNNLERMKILSSGNVGIGTPSPEAKLHVVKGSAGVVAAFANAPLAVENSTHSYINILAPSASETGVFFGKPGSNNSGGIIYNNASTLNGLQFRTNKDTARMVLTDVGNLGVGTLNPAGYKTKILHSEFGLDLEFSATGDDWELVTFGPLFLVANGEFVGSFDKTSGAYTALSDERAKTNIKPLGSMLDKINQLKPSSYQFKNQKIEKEYNGFIAQDVLKIFPSLVNHTVIKERNVDAYTMDYTGFGVIAIKGIQELQLIIEEQKQKIAKIATLEAKINKLEEIIATIAKNNGTTSNVINHARLEQNYPNPVTNTTTIPYSIPSDTRNAKITLTNIKGQLMKEIMIGTTGNGQLNITKGTLPLGTYNYSLWTDGKKVVTKQLIIAR